MYRRSFLQGILAAAVAPAFVSSGVLMPVKQIWLPRDLMYVREVTGYDIASDQILTNFTVDFGQARYDINITDSGEAARQEALNMLAAHIRWHGRNPADALKQSVPKLMSGYESRIIQVRV